MMNVLMQIERKLTVPSTINDIYEVHKCQTREEVLAMEANLDDETFVRALVSSFLFEQFILIEE